MTKIIYLIHINLVTPKARAKHEVFVQQTGLRVRVSTNLAQNIRLGWRSDLQTKFTTLPTKVNIVKSFIKQAPEGQFEVVKRIDKISRLIPIEELDQGPGNFRA